MTECSTKFVIRVFRLTKLTNFSLGTCPRRFVLKFSLLVEQRQNVGKNIICMLGHFGVFILCVLIDYNKAHVLLIGVQNGNAHKVEKSFNNKYL